jgi:glycosyltransferase involved in cell wall biosynthesis
MNNFCVQSESATPCYLLSYGRLDESKGFSDLISAFQALPISGLKLVIAGSGPEQSALQKQIDQAGLSDKISLVGQKTRAEIISLSRGAAAVVQCSRVHETFGLGVLEAMA